ncbi:MAG: cation:proton antiporter, partial [Pirellulales bacterium]
MHETHEFLKTLALVLCVAAVTTVVFQRLRQPVVLGYLLAGMVIGPHVPVPLVADSRIVLSLAELGVILLMFSLGIEFSLQKLTRVGATAGFVAVVECSLMVWLGYLLGQSFGWSRLASLYTGAVIAISSTTIIAKTYEEKQAEGEFTQIVFGVLIVEDLIAIVLITILTGLSAGDQISLGTVAQTAGRLGLFLLVLLVVGLLTVPRLMRAIVQLGRNETTVVANVGLAFGLAYLASSFGYSVALGAFIAGSLVAESGAEKQIEELIIPVRDIFAALFFVSVGMLIDPQAIVQNWLFVLIFLAVLVAGKVGAISLATFLTGRSVVTSIQTGMSLAQIGEFSFIIAGVGLMNNADDQPTYQLLYSIAIAVSGVTTLLTPWLIRAAEPVAMFVDRKLPRPLQTFAALYGSWLQQSRSASPRGETGRVRHFMRWLAVDAVVLAVVVIGAAVEVEPLADWITAR